MGKVRIGLSGWSYEEWDGDFYPTDLAASDRLHYLSRRFDTVEVNGTFYSLTNPATVRYWREQTPGRFVFAVKGSRYITHTKRLNDVGRAVANFFASGILELGGQLGPILWQLPPNMPFDGDRLDDFLGLLPRDTGEAVTLARDHDDRVEDVSYGDWVSHRIRHVVEFRDPSFLRHEALGIAKRHSVATACSHSKDWSLVSDITAGFVYVRLHGPSEIYASPYDRSELADWARRVQKWRDGGVVDDLEKVSDLAPPPRQSRDVYVYFDNTAEGHAPRDAGRLLEMVQG